MGNIWARVFKTRDVRILLCGEYILSLFYDAVVMKCAILFTISVSFQCKDVHVKKEKIGSEQVKIIPKNCSISFFRINIGLN